MTDEQTKPEDTGEPEAERAEDAAAEGPEDVADGTPVPDATPSPEPEPESEAKPAEAAPGEAKPSEPGSGTDDVGPAEPAPEAVERSEPDPAERAAASVFPPAGADAGETSLSPGARPELIIGAAFVGGLVLAWVLKRRVG